MSGAQRRRLADGRWHFQHGPIDCIVGGEGEAGAWHDAVEHAWARFTTVLDEVVHELPLLRTDLGSAAGAAVAPQGRVARRMVEACRVHGRDGRFITAMAAVAGSVAQELIASFAGPGIGRAYVNNGGDIALHLAPGASFEVGIVSDPEAALAGTGSTERRKQAARVSIDHGCGVRGIATSGWRGRSFSLGIADSVTVLAATASVADAAATVIANAVDADDPRIERAPASRLRDDSDLGDRLVTCQVPPLAGATIARALAAGAAAAQAEIDSGRVLAAALCLQGRVRTCANRAAFATLGTDGAVPGWHGIESQRLRPPGTRAAAGSPFTVTGPQPAGLRT